MTLFLKLLYSYLCSLCGIVIFGLLAKRFGVSEDVVTNDFIWQVWKKRWPNGSLQVTSNCHSISYILEVFEITSLSAFTKGQLLGSSVSLLKGVIHDSHCKTQVLVDTKTPKTFFKTIFLISWSLPLWIFGIWYYTGLAYIFYIYFIIELTQKPWMCLIIWPVMFRRTIPIFSTVLTTLVTLKILLLVFWKEKLVVDSPKRFMHIRVSIFEIFFPEVWSSSSTTLLFYFYLKSVSVHK